jgi:hypothetical protein
MLWVPTDLGGQYPTDNGGAHLLTNVGHVFGICLLIIELSAAHPDNKLQPPLLIGVTLNADKGGQA